MRRLVILLAALVAGCSGKTTATGGDANTGGGQKGATFHGEAPLFILVTGS